MSAIQFNYDHLLADQAAQVLREEEHPAPRLAAVGCGGLSDVELLALVIGGNPDKAMATARALLSRAQSVAGLACWTVADFSQAGISGAVANRLVSLAELARRMVAPPAYVAPVFNRPEIVAQHFKPVTLGLEVEKFWALSLNRKNRLMKCDEITSGTATSSLAHPREVFRAALRNGACSLICVHNHPSGDPAPSAADVQVTRQLREASRAVDIEFLDHIILGTAATDPRGTGFYSFREAGII